MDDIIFFDYNQKSSVLLIGFFHAVLFSTLLLLNGINEQKKDSKWLALFIFLGGLYICPFMLGYGGWYSIKKYRDLMFFIPFQQLFLIGPVFFFYIKSLLNSGFHLRQKDIIHFIPAFLYLIYSIVVFVCDKVILDEYFFYADGKDKDLDFWYQFSGLVSMLFYLFLSLKYYTSYRKLSLEELSYADEIAYKWLKVFALSFGLILILRILFFILNPEWGQFGRKYWYYLSFSILLLYISIAGYTATVRARKKINHLNLMDFGSLKESSEKENTNGNPSQQNHWSRKIIILFDSNKMYRNPNLTLSEVANQLNTNRNVISKAINTEFGMNFNDFVNSKRAEAVKESLHNREHSKKTLLSIAMECGFNSKTTFNRAFKKHTQLSPKQYISKNKL